MTEETLPTTSPCSPTACCGQNKLGLVALIIAIIGLLLTISFVGSVFGVPLLVISLVLGIVALFRRPRGKARASVIISAIPLGFLLYIACALSSIVVQPVFEFGKRFQNEYNQNPVMQEVFKQPGFENFLTERVQTSMKVIEWEMLL